MTKRQFFLVWLVSISLLGYFTPSVRGEVRGEENIIYEFSDVADSDDNALRLMKDMAEGRRKVRAWWGPTFEDTIHVFVGRKYRIQTSLVPAWRGNRGHFYINSRRVRDNLVTTIHNLIHIYAPNGNRLLAEGLAVYAHNRLGGPPGRPDYGRDLHQLAVEHADSFDLVHLDQQYRTPRPLPEPQVTAYIVAGSFVKYLIEQFGMDKFRALYAESPFTSGKRVTSDPDRWSKIFSKSLKEIVADWKARLK